MGVANLDGVSESGDELPTAVSDPNRAKAARAKAATDPYADDTHCWWHLSEVSPELLAALADRWLETGRGLVALDLGCGLGTEIAALAHLGYRAVGVDMSPVALQRASAADSGVLFARADVTAVPLPDASVDVVLDRGCFHYLPAISRPRYVAEAKRVLKPGGKMLLRACCNSAGVPNGISERVVSALFAEWQIERVETQDIPSDSRCLEAVVARLVCPSGS
jgi:SAM-dependent methyltransferase